MRGILVVLIHSPSFVVGSKQDCWKCGLSNEVTTLAAKTISEAAGPIDLTDVGETYLLSYIEGMPAFVFNRIAALAPRYRKLFSMTAGFDYYANVCSCGANFGDWFLFCEPGGAWFPEACADILPARVLPLPFVEPFPVDCELVTRKIVGL